ncbi:MAG: class I lanthipeptide [Hyphomicrobiales bacterium]
MKAKQNKLSFKKEVIAKLNNELLNNAKGGQVRTNNNCPETRTLCFETEQDTVCQCLNTRPTGCTIQTAFYSCVADCGNESLNPKDCI